MNSKFQVGDIVVAKPEFTFSIQKVQRIFKLEIDGWVFRNDLDYDEEWGYAFECFELATPLIAALE